MSHGSKHRTGLDLIAGGALVALPLPLLLFAKTAGVILAQGLSLRGEIASSLVFSLSASVLLLLPLVAVLLGRERVLPMLQQGKTTLLNRGELVVGSVSLGLGGYLSWQGITGLALR